MHRRQDATIVQMLESNETLRPQDDFFGYVNNDWLKNNPIPDSESKWGTFYVLRDKSLNAIKKIIKEISNSNDKDLSNGQKLLKTFFSTATKYSDYKDEHVKTLNSELQKIYNLKNKNQISKYLGYSHKFGSTSFWVSYVAVDDKNSQAQLMRIQQGGLSLPNRDYYLEKTAKMNNIRRKYEKYFKTVQHFLGKDTSGWDNVIKIEMELAQLSWGDADLRDANKNYSKFEINDLLTKFANFNWIEYFEAQGWKNPKYNIVIDQPSFIKGVMDIINNHSLDEIKDYLTWHIINDLIDYIDESAYKVKFDFYGKIIDGKKEIKPLWKRSIQQANELIIGEALGREYAAKYFPESSKKEVLKIVEDVRSAYHNRIDKVVWMTKKTKQKAHKKLDNIRVLIGYPSIWHNLDKLNFVNNNHLKNVISSRIFESDIDIAKIGKKPASEDWQMNAHTVNAYFDPNELVICFPAAILQPPFFNPTASYATNLGGIGSVVGHELTHGFDDQGADFDEQGNMNKWQSPAEQKSFKEMSKGLIKQANQYEVVPGTFLNGKLVIGEVIADIGGLELAVEALRLSQKNSLDEESLRQIFENFALAECGTERDEFAIQMAKVDPHPTSRFRVNGVIKHVDAFYDAFDVRPGDKLYLSPEERSHIW